MTRLAINPIACRGFGVCAELLPEEVRLDEWGYPIMDRRPLGIELLEHARGRCGVSNHGVAVGG
jgi:ferredoxin